MKKATFGAGCFWGVEDAFSRFSGVIGTRVGYTGGHLDNPSYEDVCTDQTGHAEALEVAFDSEQVSYDDLLDLFWRIHNPTTRNQQGADVGSQYRSVIFYHNETQKKAAVQSRHRLQASDRHEGNIVTEIVPVGIFYEAEEYHQQYVKKNRP
jgi:peptide-methionine (S)-S-oxide reductase